MSDEDYFANLAPPVAVSKSSRAEIDKMKVFLDEQRQAGQPVMVKPPNGLTEAWNRTKSKQDAYYEKRAKNRVADDDPVRVAAAALEKVPYERTAEFWVLVSADKQRAIEMMLGRK